MIAALAVETGIAPKALLSEPPEMLEAIAAAVMDRAEQAEDAGKPGPPRVHNLERLLGER